MVLQLTVVKHQILCSNLVSHNEGWLGRRTLNWEWNTEQCVMWNSYDYLWTQLHREKQLHTKHVNFHKVEEGCLWTEPLLSNHPYRCVWVLRVLWHYWTLQLLSHQPLEIISSKRVQGSLQSTVHLDGKSCAMDCDSSSLNITAHITEAGYQYVV